MCNLIFVLGLVGFVGGVIAIMALFVQRDANRQKEEAAKQHGSNDDRAS